MKILNVNKNTVPANECKVAGSFASRFVGLMGKDRLAPGSGLLIVPCNSIHMFFMKFPIDAVFLDKENNVVHIIEEIKPWRVSQIVGKAHSVLELPAGTVRSSLTEVGDRLVLG